METFRLMMPDLQQASQGEASCRSTDRSSCHGTAEQWADPTNPVHVLDLALFLPALCASGVLLLRHHRIGYSSAPGH
jgi:hypothetical protein